MIIRFKEYEMDSLQEVKKTIEDLIIKVAKKEARTQGFTKGVNFILEKQSDDKKNRGGKEK